MGQFRLSEFGDDEDEDTADGGATDSEETTAADTGADATKTTDAGKSTAGRAGATAGADQGPGSRTETATATAAETDAVPDGDGSGESTTPPATGDDTTGTPTTEDGVATTAVWAPGGVCRACDEPAQRRYLQDGTTVCALCKDW